MSKKKSLVINGKKLVYNDEHGSLSYDNIKPITEKEAQIILNKTCELFNKIDLPFALAYGTLLGAIRDNGLIKGDEDVDVFIWDETKLWNNLIYFYEEGFKVIRAVRGEYYSFRINDDCYIDIYVLRNLKFSVWQFSCYSLANYYTPKRYFTGYHEIDFLGIKCLCPNSPERLLEFWYGKNWRIPVRGHKFYYEVKSAYYWHKIKKVLKLYLKKIILWDLWGYPLKSYLLGKGRAIVK